MKPKHQLGGWSWVSRIQTPPLFVGNPLFHGIIKTFRKGHSKWKSCEKASYQSGQNTQIILNPNEIWLIFCRVAVEWDAMSFVYQPPTTTSQLQPFPLPKSCYSFLQADLPSRIIAMHQCYPILFFSSKEILPNVIN